MMDWDKLRIFHAVAKAESFTRAGEVLHLSQSAVSRQVSALEESLKTSLFHRHARGLILTEQGEILFATVDDVFKRLASAENALLESKERPRGPFTITAPTAIGTMWLTPHMREFCELYPEIQLTLLADDRELDLTKREADVAIRLYPATHPDLVQKKLTSFNNALYASQAYLRAHGTPRTQDDLCRHRLITYNSRHGLPYSSINWILEAGLCKSEPCQPFFAINSVRGMMRAVESGIGIAGLPDYMVEGLPHVVRVLPELHGPVTDVYFVYSVEMRNSKRVNVFKEFLLKKLAEGGLTQTA